MPNMNGVGAYAAMNGAGGQLALHPGLYAAQLNQLAALGMMNHHHSANADLSAPSSAAEVGNAHGMIVVAAAAQAQNHSFGAYNSYAAAPAANVNLSPGGSGGNEGVLGNTNTMGYEVNASVGMGINGVLPGGSRGPAAGDASDITPNVRGAEGAGVPDVTHRGREGGDYPAAAALTSLPAGTGAPQAGGEGAIVATASYARLDALSYAVMLRTRGKVAEASRLYDAMLAENPRQVDALVGKGLCMQAQGLKRAALECFGLALSVDGRHAGAFSHLGTLNNGSRESLHAVLDGAFQEALKADPTYRDAAESLAVVLTDVGTRLKLSGSLQDGLAKYFEAIGIEPRYAAHCNMGVIYKNFGDLKAAITCYERCLAVAPNFTIAKNNMAIALTDLGTKAVVMYELALHFNPQCAEACNNLGVIYKDRDNLEKAVECYQKALTIKPSFSQSLNNLGVVYTVQVQGKMDLALGMIQAAILANPSYAEAYNNLGALPNRLLALNYIDEGEDDALYAAHRDWGTRFSGLFEQFATWQNSKDPHRPITVGYISPDYFTHSVSYFIEGPLTHHDPASCRLVVYSAVVKVNVDVDVNVDVEGECVRVHSYRAGGWQADGKTMRFKEAVQRKGGIWRDIYGLPEKRVAAQVREDGVDVLVELTGHTANNRLGVTWIGYPNTTGLQPIDYRFTDALVDPPDTKQNCFLCYTPSSEAGPVSPSPALANGFVTFGSFNNLAKHASREERGERSVEHPGGGPLWVPGACSLDTFPYAGTTTTCESLYMGVPCVTMAGHIHAHNVGVTLLTQIGTLPPPPSSRSPFSPASTRAVPPVHQALFSAETCSSLILYIIHTQGQARVPVCACVPPPPAHVSRAICRGVLLPAGLGKLIARSEDEYVQLALQVASDIPKLAALRAAMRDKMLSSRLCDTPAFTRDLEATYRQLWLRYCATGAPAGAPGDTRDSAEDSVQAGEERGGGGSKVGVGVGDGSRSRDTAGGCSVDAGRGFEDGRDVRLRTDDAGGAAVNVALLEGQSLPAEEGRGVPEAALWQQQRRLGVLVYKRLCRPPGEILRLGLSLSPLTLPLPLLLLLL
eukprot:jgi/Mesen1/5519/ME000279S04732